MSSQSPSISISCYTETPNELIKEFTEILRNIRGVKSLKRIRPKLRELFTNDVHAEYMYSVLRYLRKRDVEVFVKVFRNYVLIRTDRVIRIPPKNIARCYVVGVNDDGKLFINRVDSYLFVDCYSDRHVLDNLVIPSIICKDYSVERVQGDLCFTYKFFSSFDEALRYVDSFSINLRDALLRFSINRIVRYLCIELSKLGIDADVVTDRGRYEIGLRVELPKTKRSKLVKYCIALGLEIDELLRDTIPNYLALSLGRNDVEHVETCLDVGNIFTQRYGFIDESTNIKFYGDVRFELIPHYPMGLDTCEVLVNLDLNDLLVKVINNDLAVYSDKHIERVEVPIRDLTVNIGNHVLEFRGTDRVVYRFKLGTEDVELAIPLRGYLVTSDVTVTHHEHGVAKFKVSGVAHVIPHSTAVHEMHRSEMNKAGLEVILSERSELVNKLSKQIDEMWRNYDIRSIRIQ